MEVAGTVLSVAQTLFAALQCTQLKEFFSIYGYESQLDELQSTVSIIEVLFRDAEAKQELSNVEQKWIQDLKDAVFEADDLLDEFATLAQQKQLVKADGRIFKKIDLFFSRTNPFGVAYKMSKGVQKIRKKLDAIADNKRFIMFDNKPVINFEHDPQPIRKRRPETCSYVDANDIIGREDDLEKIVGMLLDSNVLHNNNVSFLSIVGIGGLGKTALAQLVFNDPKVTSAFQLRMWTCVSDEDQNQVDVIGVLRKILASATGNNPDQGSTLDRVQSQVREQLAGKKYLLVLDDVWTEKRDQWCDLVKYLTGGQRGSWIVVTTRSQITATIVGDGQMHALQGLSVENSWQLFERIAFGADALNPPDSLVEIGREIIDECARVPLAIRVVGSLLYGQDKSKWESVQKMGLANLRESEGDIMPILKLSYHHLEYSLKSCFSYCAMFPKDHEIQKDMLISLWMAQGYIVPLDIGQSIEDASEEHFFILLRRCFFQDIRKKLITGEIYSVKIHDLMHDIALSISRKEICATSSINGEFCKKVRHVSIFGKEYGQYTLGKTHVRSYLHVRARYSYEMMEVDKFFMEKVVASSRYLRALNLVRLKIKSLPDCLGNLIHLRYLDLSNNFELQVLPKSITKLCNLQSLYLPFCKKLKELPKDLSRLAKLRVLDITYCDSLHYMPRGIDKLTCLHILSHFKVGSEGICSSWKQWFDGLEELEALNNLKGDLQIEIRWPKNDKNVGKEDYRRRGLYLRSKEHLKYIIIDFRDVEDDGRIDDEEAINLMEDLHPPSSLKILEVRRYHGSRMPDWVTLLPNLVILRLFKCKELEYLENFGSDGEVPFLPCLEELWLVYLPKLKGWERGDVREKDSSSSSSNKSQLQLLSCLSHLKELNIQNCLELTFIPFSSRLEILNLQKFNKRLQGVINTAKDGKIGEVAPKLRNVTIDDVAWLNSLSVEAFQFLESLKIWYDEGMEKLEEVEKVFRCCSTSLRSLTIYKCPKLNSVVGGGLEHLTALEELKIRNCKNVRLSEEEKEGEDCIDISISNMACPSLLPSLRTLKLRDLPKLLNLPDWMQFLPALQTLEIRLCEKLEAMPKWMPKLTSLTQLRIKGCLKSLERRCQQDPPGEDWPYIQHIPTIHFQGCYE